MINTFAPKMQQEDKDLLALVGEKDEHDEFAERENEKRNRIIAQHGGRGYIGGAELDDEYLGSKYQGQGYIGNAGRGYVGGVLPAFAIPLLTALAPLLTDGAFTLGKKLLGRGLAEPIRFHGKRLDMSSPSNFYRTFASEAIKNGAPEDLVMKKMTGLFSGKGFVKLMKKRTGGNLGPLRWGHLLMPPLMGHLTTALKGTGLSPDDIADIVEKDYSDFLDKDVKKEELVEGGSVMSSIWSGVKNIFGKLINNKNIQELGKKAFDTTMTHAPSLIETGINRIAKHAEKKLQGEEPELKDEDYERMASQLAEKRRKDKVERLMKKEEKKSKRRDYDDDEEEEEEYRPRQSRELPSGRSDSSRRKEAVAQRQERRVVPRDYDYDDDEEEEKPRQSQSVIKVNRDIPYEGWKPGMPIGRGISKKKKFGGAWTVRLERE